MIAYYLDEHISPAVAKRLSLCGVDVLTPHAAKTLGAADVDHLRLAAQQRRVLVTADHDFLRLHGEGVPHAGIVFVTRQRSVGDVISALLLVHGVCEADELQGQVEYV